MAQSWYVRLNGKVQGPATSAQLKALAQSGRVAADTPVSLDGKNWTAARNVAGLVFGTAGRVASAPPPMPAGKSHSSGGMSTVLVIAAGCVALVVVVGLSVAMWRASSGNGAVAKASPPADASTSGAPPVAAPPVAAPPATAAPPNIAPPARDAADDASEKTPLPVSAPASPPPAPQQLEQTSAAASSEVADSVAAPVAASMVTATPATPALPAAAPQQPPRKLLNDDDSTLPVEITAAVENFVAGNYRPLAELADDYRQNKTSFSSGDRHLDLLYDLFRMTAYAGEERFESACRTCDVWAADDPQASTPKLLLAMLWEAYAWVARGGGDCRTVSKQGWELFRSRIAKAERYLAEAKRSEQVDPYAYRLDVWLAIDSGSPRTRVSETLRESLAADREYYAPYLEAVRFLLPRWYGEPGELAEFADLAMYEFSERGDKGLYARMVYEASLYHGERVFKDFDFYWPMVNAGYEELSERHPNSLRLISEHCRLAYFAGEHLIAQAIFKRLNGQIDSQVWPSDGLFWYCFHHSRGDFRGGEQTWLAACLRPVQRVMWNQEGSAVMATTSHEVSLWDFRSLAPLMPLMAQPPQLLADALRLDALPDFERMVLQLRPPVAEGEARKVGVLTGSLLEEKSLVWPEYPESFMAACADGSLVEEREGAACFWDPDTGKLVRTVRSPYFETPGSTLAALVISADGRWLAKELVKPDVVEVVVLDVLDGTERMRVKLPDPQSHPARFRFSPDGTRLAVGVDRRVQIWSVESSQREHELDCTLHISDMAFSPDGSRLVTATTNLPGPEKFGTLYTWDTKTGMHLKSFKGHQGNILCVEVSPDGKYFVTGGDDVTVRIWKMP